MPVEPKVTFLLQDSFFHNQYMLHAVSFAVNIVLPEEATALREAFA
jgi:hypothetical protein